MKDSALPVSLRTAKSERAYQLAKKNGSLPGLANEPPVVRGLFWKFIKNRSPADVAFRPETSHMIIPRRKFANWWNMWPWETAELIIILWELRAYSGQLTLNLGKTRSVQDHFHLHLNMFVKTRREMRL